jgi:integrase
MANHTAKLYIRGKVGYSKAPKRVADLPSNETFMLFWYEGRSRKAKAVGRFADAAQTALINKEAELRLGAILNAPPTVASTPVPPPVEPKTDAKHRDLAECVELYLSEVQRGKAKKTYVAYNIALRGFCKVCKAHTVDAMTRNDVLRFTDMLRDSHLTPRTIANRLNFLKTFFRHFDLAWPMLKTDRVKFTEKVAEAYSVEDLRSLFAAANQDELELFQFLLCTGVREQEAMFATWPDVNLHAKKFKVTEKFDLGFTPKDKEEGAIPVPDSMIALLQGRRLRYPNTRLIFPMPDGKPNGHMLRTLQRLAFRSGLNCGCCYNRAGQCCKNKAMCHYWGLHRFRKTFATMHHEAGVTANTKSRRFIPIAPSEAQLLHTLRCGSGGIFLA